MTDNAAPISVPRTALRRLRPFHKDSPFSQKNGTDMNAGSTLYSVVTGTPALPVQLKTSVLSLPMTPERLAELREWWELGRARRQECCGDCGADAKT